MFTCCNAPEGRVEQVDDLSPATVVELDPKPEETDVPAEPPHREPEIEANPIHTIAEEEELSMWDCVIANPDGKKLGINVKNWHPARLQITSVAGSDSAVGQYNESAPKNKQIQADDIITRVNDIEDQVPMKDLMKSGLKEFTMTVARPRKLKLEISRVAATHAWGIDIEFLPTNAGLFVKGIKDGLVIDTYNQSQETAETQLRLGDTIVQVGNLTGAEMVQAMKSDLLTPTLVLARIAAPYTIFYHGACKRFIARAFGAICLLEAAGAKYEVLTPDFVPRGSTTFAPPMMTMPDGSTIGQSGAMVLQLGARLGLAPPGTAARRRALQLVDDHADFLGDVFGKKGSERVMKWVKHFDKLLGSQGFFMGDKCTYVDYSVLLGFLLLSSKKQKGSEDVKGVELTEPLRKWLERMHEEPAVKKVLAMPAPLFLDTML